MKFTTTTLFLLLTCSIQAQSLTRYVDPYIGTAAHGHVFVGANVPFGAVQLGPTNIESGWDWCSGYHYSSNNIVGFAHTHLSGTGIGDLGDILMMPATGEIVTEKGSQKDFSGGYTSGFSRANEITKPGYYSVMLDKYKIKAELTASERVGFHQYHFPAGAKTPHIILDLIEGIGWDLATDVHIQAQGDRTLVGHRFSKGWASDQRVFFAITFSQPISKLTLYSGRTTVDKKITEIKNARASINFSSITGNTLQVKVGISPVSHANALENIEKEIPHWDFAKVATDADRKWNEELERVKIDADEKTKKIFYTALYHAMVAPSLFNDVNGEYRGTDKKVYSNPGFNNYTTFSLWDTYRAWHPLATIIFPEKIEDYIGTFLAIYKQQGKLPVWHLHGNETNTMVGYSAVPVLADAYLKGYRKNYDVALAYEAAKQSAMQKNNGIEFIQQLKHIPAEKVSESVAKALEYAVDDWGIAQMAKSLGKTDDYNYFTKRYQLYKQYFDPSLGFMRGKMANGSWRTPFDPRASKHRDDDYTEGNSWQYTFLVPQDVEGLIALFGGDKPFIKKLDSLFIVPADLGKESSPDISGLIGNYAHGNEPGHHILYLYAYAGQQWKTAKWVRKVFEDFYTDKPDGLCGNEDVGQMSAWYLLSAMGLYPVNPANGAYVFGSPAINSATITVKDGKKFTIKTRNNSKENIYIQKVTLNGQPYSKSFITHSDMTKGGTLVFEMGSKPSNFGTKKSDRPISNILWQ